MYQECSNRHTICNGIDWFCTLFQSVRQRWKWLAGGLMVSWKWPDRWPNKLPAGERNYW